MKKVKLGVCQAIVSSISTQKDKSIKITIDVNPEDQDLVAKLMRIYLEGDQALSVTFEKEDC